MEFFYVYCGDGNIDRSIDIFAQKEYTYVYDEETKLYYLQSRYYDSVVGRFVNADDINILLSPSHKEINVYTYGYNTPIITIDFIGYSPFYVHLAHVVSGISTLFG